MGQYVRDTDFTSPLSGTTAIVVGKVARASLPQASSRSAPPSEAWLREYMVGVGPDPTKALNTLVNKVAAWYHANRPRAERTTRRIMLLIGYVLRSAHHAFKNAAKKSGKPMPIVFTRLKLNRLNLLFYKAAINLAAADVKNKKKSSR